MCSPDNPDLGKAEHFGQRASAFLRPVIGSCSTNRNQQYWNLIGEKAEFTRDGHRIEADHRARAEPMHFGGISSYRPLAAPTHPATNSGDMKPAATEGARRPSKAE